MKCELYIKESFHQFLMENNNNKKKQNLYYIW